MIVCWLHTELVVCNVPGQYVLFHSILQYCCYRSSNVFVMLDRQENNFLLLNGVHSHLEQT